MDYASIRYDICKQCEHFNNILKICKICHCFLPAKTTFKSAVCPATPPKWLALNEPGPECQACTHKDH